MLSFFEAIYTITTVILVSCSNVAELEATILDQDERNLELEGQFKFKVLEMAFF